MNRPTIEIKTGPYLFGDIKATRYGPIWRVEPTYSLWQQMYFAGIETFLTACLPPKTNSQE